MGRAPVAIMKCDDSRAAPSMSMVLVAVPWRVSTPLPVRPDSMFWGWGR